jgi:nitrogen regulatory protein PII
MHMIDAVIKPNRLDAVKNALVQKGIIGATAVECKGYGKQLGHSPRYRGPKLEPGFVPKVILRVCVQPHDLEVAIQTIVEAARTGEVGDGKIFVYPMERVIRIRTGESGDTAI